MTYGNTLKAESPEFKDETIADQAMSILINNIDNVEYIESIDRKRKGKFQLYKDRTEAQPRRIEVRELIRPKPKTVPKTSKIEVCDREK